jgi:quinol monooxygenase YgiN
LTRPPTGNTTFVIDERYASSAGIANHWQETADWAEMSSAAPAWFEKATIATLHNGTAVEAL